jgi:transposase-like protein
MKCPVCGIENASKPLKSWMYGPYVVSRYLCDHCGEKFNEYVSDVRKSFTLPKRVI